MTLGAATPPPGPVTFPPSPGPGALTYPLPTGKATWVAVSKRLRYEILRRDNHACRYCGKVAPGTELVVDHVIPVALGGADEPSNLVAACRDCNIGKSSSNPDAPLVEDVSADALRWASAMARAADYLMSQHRERAEIHAQFLERWNGWTYGGFLPKDRKTLPLEVGWQQSVDTLLAAGLPVELLHECIDRAMNAKHVLAENTFRYMCGIAWRKVKELQEIATDIVTADEADEDR